MNDRDVLRTLHGEGVVSHVYIPSQSPPAARGGIQITDLIAASTGLYMTILPLCVL